MQADHHHSSEPSTRWVLTVVILTNVVVLGWIAYFTFQYPDRWERPLTIAHDPAAVDAHELERLMAIGEREYGLLCSSCHGIDGAGIPGQGPPLAGSRWVNEDPKIVARIVMHGMRQSDRGFIQPMQGWDVLADRELAGVLTYMRRSWGNESDPVSPHTVLEVRADTRDRLRDFSKEELEALLNGGAGEIDEAEPEEETEPEESESDNDDDSNDEDDNNDDTPSDE